MDASSLECKKLKLNEKRDMDGGNKSIDRLPDAVLEHILSFLPTKVAVRTSVLSKKWQYLWTSIPNLEFLEGLPNKRMLFMNFVERMLVLHDLSYINTFSLSCKVLHDASRVNAWISAAVRHNVQQLKIWLHDFEEPFVLPRCLFTCQTLKKLDLDMSCILKLPSSVHFSSLKILKLSSVVFMDEYLTQQLFSGPTLEKLYLMYCNWVNLKAVRVSAPKLWSLTIYEMDGFDLSHSDGCQVMIFGTSLKTLDYSGEFLNDYCLYDSTSLVEAYICYLPVWHERPEQVVHRVNKLLRGLSNVKDLRLSRASVDVLTHATELFAHLPIFNNLTNLELEPGTIDFDCEALLKILQNSPCLRTLKFTESISLDSEDWILDPVPPCFLSHLKIIKLQDFAGTEEELIVVRTLIKSTKVLEKMVISWFKLFTGGLEIQKKVHEQLLELTNEPGSCKLLFN